MKGTEGRKVGGPEKGSWEEDMREWVGQDGKRTEKESKGKRYLD